MKRRKGLSEERKRVSRQRVDEKVNEKVEENGEGRDDIKRLLTLEKEKEERLKLKI